METKIWQPWVCVTAVGLLAGCAVESEPTGPSSDESDGTGGAESDSDKSTYPPTLAEGETLVGSCHVPRGTLCETRTSGPVYETDEEGGHDWCQYKYDDAFGEDLWRPGEWCPQDRAIGYCRHGTIYSFLYNNENTQEQMEGHCASLYGELFLF